MRAVWGLPLNGFEYFKGNTQDERVCEQVVSDHPRSGV